MLSYALLSFLPLFVNAYGDVSKTRMLRQISPAQNGQVLDNIFNIPITAIKETAAAAQIFSPENTQTINSIFKIPVSTLEAVGTLVKSTTQQRQRNAADIQTTRQERQDRSLAVKEQKRKRKEEIRKQRLLQQQLKRIMRHHHKDPFGLNALSDILIGQHGFLPGHQISGLGHHSGLSGIHGLHSGHGFHGNHGVHHGGHHGGIHNHGIFSSHGGHSLSGRPQNTYAVHEDVDEDTTISWNGVSNGFGNFFNPRPSDAAIKIENKIAPKEKRQRVSKYSSDDVHGQYNYANIRNKLPQKDNDPPLENKIAPRHGTLTFVRR